MSDYIKRPAHPKRSGRTVGVRELKTHAAHIVRQVREAQASYVVTHRGRAVGVILPVDSAEEAAQTAEDPDATAAWNAFLRAGRRLERRFRPGVSGVQLLSSMRR
ncbi:MAG: type II toxin-antitoxin system prevent-host-death family antitoxin [Luteitalea sp.]|nr:type II toxin-antitoxin system prevent-host-death family antitoxin [Luteitalea sp.]